MDLIQKDRSIVEAKIYLILRILVDGKYSELKEKKLCNPDLSIDEIHSGIRGFERNLTLPPNTDLKSMSVYPIKQSAGTKGTIYYFMWIDGSSSDLVLIFDVTKTISGVDVVLYDLHG